MASVLYPIQSNHTPSVFYWQWIGREEFVEIDTVIQYRTVLLCVRERDRIKLFFLYKSREEEKLLNEMEFCVKESNRMILFIPYILSGSPFVIELLSNDLIEWDNEKESHIATNFYRQYKEYTHILMCSINQQHKHRKLHNFHLTNAAYT